MRFTKDVPVAFCDEFAVWKPGPYHFFKKIWGKEYVDQLR